MTTYDPAEVGRLIAEAREDDARMAQLEGHERALWRAVEATRKDIGRLRHYVTCIPADHPCWSGNDMVAWSRLGIWTSDGVTEQAFAEAIARTRNNLRPLADHLEVARAEIERLRSQAEFAERADEHKSQVIADLAAARAEADQLRARVVVLEGSLTAACDLGEPMSGPGDPRLREPHQITLLPMFTTGTTREQRAETWADLRKTAAKL